MWRPFLILSAAAAATVALAAQAPVTGTWILTVTSPDGTSTLRARLVEEDGRVSGTIVTGDGDVPLRGARSGAALTMRWTFALGGEPFEVVLDGTVGRDGTLAGTARFAGAEPATWSAVRAPAAADAEAEREPADVAGHWTLTLDTPQGATRLVVDLTQDGTDLHGSARAPGSGTVPVTGTVTGRAMAVSLDLRPDPLAISAMVEDGTLSGTFRLGTQAPGTLVGTRTED